jgi:hypothetical protein
VLNHFVKTRRRGFNYSYISPERAMKEAVSVIAPAGAMARALPALVGMMDLAPLGETFSSLGKRQFDFAKMLKIAILAKTYAPLRLFFDFVFCFDTFFNALSGWQRV